MSLCALESLIEIKTLTRESQLKTSLNHSTSDLESSNRIASPRTSSSLGGFEDAGNHRSQPLLSKHKRPTRQPAPPWRHHSPTPTTPAHAPAAAASPLPSAPRSLSPKTKTLSTHTTLAPPTRYTRSTTCSSATNARRSAARNASMRK
jgi:hypothetical protein